MRSEKVSIRIVARIAREVIRNQRREKDKGMAFRNWFKVVAIEPFSLRSPAKNRSLQAIPSDRHGAVGKQFASAANQS